MEKEFIKFVHEYKNPKGENIIGKYSLDQVFKYDFSTNSTNYQKVELEDGYPDNFYLDGYDIYYAFKAGFEAGKSNGS